MAALVRTGPHTQPDPCESSRENCPTPGSGRARPEDASAWSPRHSDLRDQQELEFATWSDWEVTSVISRSDVRVESWATDEGLGLLVYDPMTGAGHVLNPATAAVFELCDGRSSREQMADAIAESTGLPTDVDIVDLALVELAEAGLLGEQTTSGPVSRRAVIGRLALGAAAVAMLPAVMSVIDVGQAAASTGQKPSVDYVPISVDNKSISTAEATPVDVTLTSVGGFSGSVVVFWIATDPAHGTVALTGTTAIYTPAAGFTGTDTFTYLAGQCVLFVDVGAAAQTGRASQTAGVAPTCSSGQLVSSEGAATVTIVVSAPVTTTTTTTTATTATTTTATAAAKPATAAATQPTFTG